MDDRRRDFSDRPMYDAICSGCKKECKVPYKPAEGRDVFCRDCYQKNRRDKF